ncbi:MAG TPA: glycoside hydrolase family 2, partial [Paludibacter sp.]
MKKKYRKLFSKERMLLALFVFLGCNLLSSQTVMVNVQSRHLISLNGKWNVMIDQGDIGGWKKFWIEPKLQKKTDFFEYSFDGAPELNVPGDYNSQMCELSFYEGSVWYRKLFN